MRDESGKKNQTERNYNENNMDQIKKKHQVWNWKENQLEEGWKTK
jgi:hypothetical protein